MKKKWANSGLRAETARNHGAASAHSTSRLHQGRARSGSVQSLRHSRYSTATAPGIRMPTRPFDSTATAMPTPSSTDSFHGATARAARGRSRCCAISASALRVSCRPKLSDMSSVAMRASPRYSSALAWISVASSAVRVSTGDTPARTSAALPGSRTAPATARAVQACSPNSVYDAAVAQYCSAGFSKYLIAFSRGVIQSPLATISRGISA